MKRGIVGFDIAFFAFTLALLFSFGFGIGKGKSEPIKETIVLELTLTEKKGKFGENESLLIDGRVAADLIFLSESEAHICTEASLASAGWLLSSGKYVSENQPIKFYSDTSYIEGRVKRISKSPRNACCENTFMKNVQKNKVFL